MKRFGYEKLVDLIALVKEEKISNVNAKEVMMSIVDGDQRMPS